ncbi:hypothetical protein L8P92_00910 [Enterobacter asburiae]|uniref:hypothetical protein n=1 Tax=Enterobacter asburiae TaxID=61645 RepID=UPI002005DBC2|nr:hypothetical protein [Enterobacter asburiae]MCK7060483.1 hypothetical protein [Enterobacter asburiae]
MSNLAIIQEKVRTLDAPQKESFWEELSTLASQFFLNGKSYSTKREYFFEITYTTGEEEKIAFKTTLSDSSGEHEVLEPGTKDSRSDKLVAIAHNLASKGFNIDEAQLALFLNDKIQRLICKKR